MLLSGPGAAAGTKAGNPWHGTWTDAGLELPNTTVIVLANPPEGDAAACQDWGLVNTDPRPEGSPWPSYGDCFLVRIPEQPAVETSVDEAAKGMEWLNYALFCGATHALYDVKLGRDYFVYIDDDGTPWLAHILRVSSSVKITMARNFDFRGQSETHEIIVPLVFFYPGGFYDFYILDASETGRALTIGAINRTDGLLFLLINPTVYALTLSGIPGIDLSGSFQTPLYEDGYTWVVTSLPGNPAEHSAGTEYHLEEVTQIFDGDTPVHLKLGWFFDVSALTWNFGLDHYDPVTWDGYLRIVTEYGEVQIPATITRTWTSASDWSDDVDVGVYSYTWTSNDTLTRGVVWKTLPALIAWRRSNKVIEVAFSNIDPLPLDSTDVDSICLVLPDRFETTGYLITQNNPDRYFSYHPVTQELLESSFPVCFM